MFIVKDKEVTYEEFLKVWRNGPYRVEQDAEKTWLVEDEQIKKGREIEELQSRLDDLHKDLVQDLAGEVVPNLKERKKEFVVVHNRIRELQGKLPRELKKP
jgi:ferritin-like protein